MTFAIRPPSIASPCNNVCAIDPACGLCVGCGRSLDEIANWLAMSDADRSRVTAELPRRLASLQPADPRSAGPS
jgi:predicted Fe-S protein YdhL (DUF1289 family)